MPKCFAYGIIAEFFVNKIFIKNSFHFLSGEKAKVDLMMCNEIQQRLEMAYIIFAVVLSEANN
jgi:hypothetical protein